MEQDKMLLALLQENEEAGMELAMERYGRAVHTICYQILNTSAPACIDDAVADTFYKIWKSWRNFNMRKGASLKSWIYQIARNCAVDQLRTQSQKEQVLDEEIWKMQPGGEEPLAVLQSQEHQQLLHEIIAQLGEPDSSVFLYKYFMGLKNKQLAGILHLKEKQVENILYRGKKKLRRILEGKGIGSYESF